MTDHLGARLASLDNKILQIIKKTADMPQLPEHFFFNDIIISLNDYLVENYVAKPSCDSINSDLIYFKINQD